MTLTMTKVVNFILESSLAVLFDGATTFSPNFMPKASSLFDGMSCIIPSRERVALTMTVLRKAEFCSSNNAVKTLHTKGFKNRVVNSAIWITAVRMPIGNSGMVDRRWLQ